MSQTMSVSRKRLTSDEGKGEGFSSPEEMLTLRVESELCPFRSERAVRAAFEVPVVPFQEL